MRSCRVNVGDQIGELTVLERVGKNDRGYYLFKCRCSCGKEVVQSTQILTNRGTKFHYCGSGHCWRAKKHEIDGVFYTIQEIAEKTGIPQNTIRKRLSQGVCGKQLLKQPSKHEYVINGKHYHSLQEIANVAGVSKERIRQRIKGGWKMEDLTLGPQESNAGKIGSGERLHFYKQVAEKVLQLVRANEKLFDARELADLRVELLKITPPKYMNGELLEFLAGRSKEQ